MGRRPETKLDPQHVKIVRKIARGLARRLPKNVQREDLEQAGMLGLVDALRRHPASSGQGFEWYLHVRIRGAILDWMRLEDWLPRRTRVRVSEGRVPIRILRFDDMRGPRDPDGTSKPAQFAIEQETPEEVAIRNVDAAKAWTTPMPPRDARVLRLTFERGRAQKDVATIEGVTEPRISQLHARGLGLMREHMGGTR